MTEIKTKEIGYWELTFYSQDGKHHYSIKGNGWKEYHKAMKIYGWDKEHGER